MTITAILVLLRKRADVIGFAIGIVMLMCVMTEMLYCRALFVLAIDCRRAPGKLERHDNQQQNGEQFFHAKDHNIENSGGFISASFIAFQIILQAATSAGR